MIAAFKNGCVVNTKNRTITLDTKTSKMRNHCWIILEALLEAKKHNWNTNYNQLSNLIWEEPIADASRIKAIQGCMVEIRKKLNHIEIENESNFGYRIIEEVEFKDEFVPLVNPVGYHASLDKAMEINKQIDTLLTEMEQLQNKLLNLENDKDSFLYKAYETSLLAKGLTITELRSSVEDLIECKNDGIDLYNQILEHKKTSIIAKRDSGAYPRYSRSRMRIFFLRDDVYHRFNKLENSVNKNSFILNTINTILFEINKAYIENKNFPTSYSEIIIPMQK